MSNERTRGDDREYVPTPIERAAMEWARSRMREVWLQVGDLRMSGQEPWRVVIPRRYADACGTEDQPTLLVGLPVVPGDVDEPIVEARPSL